MHAVLDQSHASKLSHSRAKTVTGSFELGTTVNTFESVHFGDDLASDRVCGFLEAVVDLAATFGPHLIVRLISVQICDPVLNRR